ncbi:N-acetylglucosamine-6-phosphate deacetylase [Thalassorhabdomicrobium marinisediminis]|uniref:N-acetylglucosamine-6-phosphate deacetylase n=1 Tax=Thalassorhabdomicrobium marinisediminis TaxID=2170577 RepID=UPI00249336D7|nr:N-acetylglucosamine-6-phosphate deacetylase [Thalassorhabdomicrobium marinisediminis]
MTDLWLAPDLLFDGERLQPGQALHLVDGVVAGIGPAPTDAQPLPGLVTPGFVDLQVNGGGGVMVNSTPTPDGIRRVLAAHRSLGTVAILPTVITDAPEVLEQVTEAALTLTDEPGFAGLHIEGPHISTARRGTHAARFVRPLDAPTLACVERLRAQDVPVMITVAPESASPEQVATLTRMGAVVSVGHSDATAEEARALINAGACCGTHLFNAMSPMLGRAPGVTGALINSECYTGIICDGHHVADEMVGLALRARPRPDRMFLVSDAMATVGGPASFDLYGRTISVRDGKLVNDEGSLAGAHVTQAEGVQRLVQHVGVSAQDALRMAITTPAACIGRPKLAQLVGRPAQDVIVLSEGLEYRGDLPTTLAGR